LHHPGLRAGAFDVVYSSGVLHHTPDPSAAFASIVRLARPGGMIVVGVYNAFARMPLRARRFVARLFAYRFIPCDPVLSDRESEPARCAAWLRDQYQHPEEHRHTWLRSRTGLPQMTWNTCVLTRVQCWVRNRRSCSQALQITGALRDGWRRSDGLELLGTREAFSLPSVAALRP
jgi:SAM-dependent methyltransferase